VKSDNVRLISIEKLSKRRDGEQLAEPGWNSCMRFLHIWVLQVNTVQGIFSSGQGPLHILGQYFQTEHAMMVVQKTNLFLSLLSSNLLSEWRYY
jgi:hypothetical protein